MEQYLVHVREKGVYKAYSQITADEWITYFILTYSNNEKRCTAYLTLNLDSRPVKPATSTNDSVKNSDNIELHVTETSLNTYTNWHGNC